MTGSPNAPQRPLPERLTKLSKSDFLQTFGGIYEHSAWVAEQLWRKGHDGTLEGLCRTMADIVEAADGETKLRLIQAHPQLAVGKAAQATLTTSSQSEQKSAGLDACSAVEFDRFQALNGRYKSRFGFPFVMAVRGRTRADILAAMETRIENDPTAEFKTAMTEIHKIARLRLAALVDEA